MEETRSFRGISKRAAVGYLENLGGERTDGSVIEGDGWRAELSEDTVSIGKTLTLNEVTVEFEGDEDRVPPVIEQFAQKAIRAGG